MTIRRFLLSAALVAAVAVGPAIADCLATGRADDGGTRMFAARAEAGDPAAQYRLAWAYQDGVFVAANAATAARLYRAAAEQGHPGAQAALAARQHAEGDFAGARTWAEAAAGHGSTEAAYLLGRIHSRGDGVEIDPAAAFRWVLQAELQGHVVARHERRAVARLVPADERRAIAATLSAATDR